MKVDDLISPLVPYKDHERTMALFDIIIDEYRNALVKLLSHPKWFGDKGDERIRGL